jgi:integrase
MNRRGHGEGTIYQRKDGRYEASLRLGEGKRRSFYGKTRKEVRDKLNEALRAHESGRLSAGSRLTVSAYLDQWLEDRVKPTVRATTYASYARNVRLIASYIGSVRLDALRHTHIQHAYLELGETKLSGYTTHQAHRVLRAALRQAVKEGRIAHNPLDLVTPPRLPSKEIKPLFPEQAETLIEQTEDDRLHALWVLLLTTGMRVGEALGLGWEDVNLEAGTLLIHRQLQHHPGEGKVLAEPKTQRSRRTVHLAAGTITALRHHQTQQKLERIAEGPKWTENGLVFRTQTGGMLEHSTVLHALHRALDACGLPRIRVHDLRHTAATYLLSIGTHPRVVQDLLGHSSYTLTMNTYSHVVPGLHKDVANQMDHLFKRKADVS